MSDISRGRSTKMDRSRGSTEIAWRRTVYSEFSFLCISVLTVHICISYTVDIYRIWYIDKTAGGFGCWPWAQHSRQAGSRSNSAINLKKVAPVIRCFRRGCCWCNWCESWIYLLYIDLTVCSVCTLVHSLAKFLCLMQKCFNKHKKLSRTHANGN